MPCPECGSDQTNVVWSGWVPEDEWLRRRRKCNACGHRWNTKEILLDPGYRRPWHRQKEVDYV